MTRNSFDTLEGSRSGQPDRLPRWKSSRGSNLVEMAAVVPFCCCSPLPSWISPHCFMSIFLWKAASAGPALCRDRAGHERSGQSRPNPVTDKSIKLLCATPLRRWRFPTAPSPFTSHQRAAGSGGPNNIIRVSVQYLCALGPTHSPLLYQWTNYFHRFIDDEERTLSHS